jgi:hypothetical protein
MQKVVKKSKFLSPLINRDGLNYPKPGSWMRNVSFNKLATLAKNLDISKSKNYPDKLSSIPTPWARLLLFESALYDKDHPAHDEVKDQWRGLLGLIGLADILGLGRKLSVSQFSLRDQPDGDLKNAFAILKPQHMVDGNDLEEDKWNDFGLIYFDNMLLGGTSPRTIVFTGISHQCPAAIPFCSPQGRLGDPSKYYRKHDTQYLDVIKQWLDILIDTISKHNGLESWFGERPSDPTAQPESRHQQLLDTIIDWRSDLKIATSGMRIIPAGFSRLPAPYDFIKHIERIENGDNADSDLFLRGHKDVIVCYRPESNSVLLDSFGNQVTGQPLKLFPGHLIIPGQPLPSSLDFFPSHFKVIQNPIELFEDTLIEIQVIDSRTVSCLSCEDKNYLLPFKRSITKYFTELETAEIVRNVRVLQPNGNTIRVELTIPLIRGRSVSVFRDYRKDRDIISNDNLDLLTQELAMWPDFICPGQDENDKPFFEHYFYYTNDSGRTQVEFTPLGGEFIVRALPEKGKRWYLSKTPLLGFAGSVNDKNGILLINHLTVAAPTKYWKVGVDFGSTHTSVFYREVEAREDGKWVGIQDSTIEPLFIDPRVRILTVGDAAQIQENFFLYKTGSDTGHSHEASITTQLSMPISRPDYYADNWLPREGQVFLGSLLDSIPNNLHTDLKWNTDRSNHSTSAFLRSLQVMVEAEALHRGARVASVSHAYPTAFPEVLKLKHIEEWMAVERCVNAPIDSYPLSEALAVCRHLWAEQRALPLVNVIALDIGGSTTDIAVWAAEAMQIQESVKMAAGAVSKYIESDAAEGYRAWFLKKLTEDEPFRGARIFETGSSQGTLKRRRVYHAALKRLSEGGLMINFINAVKASARITPEVRDFLSPIVFLFAAISYYAGLLTRKSKMVKIKEYYLFFCGKGGQLLRWLPEGETLVKEMYSAGLSGPQANTSPQSSVDVRISKFPKEEVGRGLLIERKLKENSRLHTGEMFSEVSATVTVAESGYDGIEWDDDLSYEKLSIIKNNMPDTSALSELIHFVETFASSILTKGIADHYGMGHIITTDVFKATLEQRLSDNLGSGSDDALIEPLFITETKILMEIMTGEVGLFD